MLRDFLHVCSQKWIIIITLRCCAQPRYVQQHRCTHMQPSCRPRPYQHTGGGHNQCECIYCCNSYKNSYIIIIMIKSSTELIEVRSDLSPTSSNWLFFVWPNVTMIVDGTLQLSRSPAYQGAGATCGPHFCCHQSYKVERGMELCQYTPTASTDYIYITNRDSQWQCIYQKSSELQTTPTFMEKEDDS